MMTLSIPYGTLVVLSGLPAAGKSSLREHAEGLPADAWVSSDEMRERLGGLASTLVDGRPRKVLRQATSAAAFALMERIVTERVREGLTTVVDATSVTDTDRKTWASIAQKFGAPVLVLILDTPLEACLARAEAREVYVEPEVIRGFAEKLQLQSQYPYRVISSEMRLKFEPRSLPHEHIDVVGDVHGLYDDFAMLAGQLGWRIEDGVLRHTDPRRKMLFLGDLVDRGPDSLAMLRLVRRSVLEGTALAIQGNHEAKLVQFLDAMRGEGLKERWSSYANAEAGMKLLLECSDAELDELVGFMRRLPASYVFHPATMPQDVALAFVHADIETFDPATTPRSRLVRGDSRFGKPSLSDVRYSEGLIAGVNNHVLFRGHIPATGDYPGVFSLEAHAWEQGDLLALPLDRWLAGIQEVIDKATLLAHPMREAFRKCVVRQGSSFSFEAHSNRNYGLSRELSRLVSGKHVRCYRDPKQRYFGFKYSKSTFWNNGWGESPVLLKARGLVLAPDGSIISHPFDKVFNLHENGTGDDLAPDTPIVAVDKFNGFLGIVSFDPLGKDLLVHTQGSFEGEFVDYVNELMTPAQRGRARAHLAKDRMTLMFEVIHPQDPHIVEYTDEHHGLWLIGARRLGQDNRELPEQALDELADRLGFRRPRWYRTTHGELLARVRTGGEHIEGFMARADTPEQRFLYKLKSPFYLVTKFMGRLSSGNIRHMYAKPQSFRQKLDEEFYPLVDLLIEQVSEDELLGMTDVERVALVRQLVTEML